MEDQKQIEAYNELFKHMNEIHGLILLQSEMDDIIKICVKTVEKYDS
jgi:hypothetical protein